MWLIPKYGWGSVFLAGGGLSLLVGDRPHRMLPEIESASWPAKDREPETIARILRRLAPDLQLPANPRSSSPMRTRAASRSRSSCCSRTN